MSSDENGNPLDPNRAINKNQIIVPANGRTISVDQITTIFICEGLSAQDLANRFSIPVASIERIIEDNNLNELRAAHIKHGLMHIQNVQLSQAEKLMGLENQFKRLRIIQLEKTLEDYAAYYARHNHFYKTHPITGEILRDTNGIPMQIKLPNITKELIDLKEGFSLSEGLKMLLGQIDSIINKPSRNKEESLDIIDVTDIDSLFKKKIEDDKT